MQSPAGAPVRRQRQGQPECRRRSVASAASLMPLSPLPRFLTLPPLLGATGGCGGTSSAVELCCLTHPLPLYPALLARCRQIKAAVLQSARLDMRTSFAAGFVEEDRLLLFPIDEARSEGGGGGGLACGSVGGCCRPCAAFGALAGTPRQMNEASSRSPYHVPSVTSVLPPPSLPLCRRCSCGPPWPI